MHRNRDLSSFLHDGARHEAAGEEPCCCEARLDSRQPERELERRAKHKLAVLKHVEEVSGSVSATCRYYGSSRNCYDKWLKRYEEEGFEGLKDRSSTPHNSPSPECFAAQVMSWRLTEQVDR